MPDVSTLEVQLYGETIGTLTSVQGDRTLFAFTQAYIDNPQRPTLSLSFKDDLGGLITEFRPFQRVLPPFFSNLLPEGPLRKYLAERAGVNEQREFFLLWMLGRDLPGALSVRPAEGEALPPGVDAAPDSGPSNALRFSLAGVQLKFSAFKNAHHGNGLTIPAQGVGGSWIVKLPSQQFEGVPENEYAMMSIASKIGIDVPEIQLLELDAIQGLPEGIGDLKGHALAVKRFDRSPEGPVHIEDFAQVFSVFPDDKYKKASYASIAKVIGIETGSAGTSEYIRRLVFSTLIGNADMHLKNWSLIYPDRRNATISPAYDLLSTIPYIADETAALNYSRTKKMTEFSLDELAHLAAKARLPETLVLQTAKETTALFRDIWTTEKTHLAIDERVIKAIDGHLAKVPLYAEA